MANPRDSNDNMTAGTADQYQHPPCPKCRSLDTTSAAKNPTANSYWRCQKCGDVFSPALLSDASRRGYR